MKLFIYLINPCIPLLVYIVGCNTKKVDTAHSKNKPKAKHTTLQVVTTTTNTNTATYTQVINNIASQKNKLKKKYTNMDVPNYNKAATTISKAFENQLLPYWLGTPWDFNGTTQVPGTGAIACGYFVTTTLAHLGVQIDIAKYAQCGSEVMMKYLVAKENYKIYNQLTFKEFIAQLKSKPNFFAIVGLDFHTGYLLKNGINLYFIHSSYINRRGVIKQIAAESSELQSSKWKSVAFITSDAAFLQKWLAT